MVVRDDDDEDVSKAESSLFLHDEVVNDPSTKFLANNPGNFKRNKAVTVDLSEFEHLRLQLE